MNYIFKKYIQYLIIMIIIITIILCAMGPILLAVAVNNPLYAALIIVTWPLIPILWGEIRV